MNPQTAILIKQVEAEFAKADSTHRRRIEILNQALGAAIMEKNLQAAINAHLSEMNQQMHTLLQKIILMAEQATNGEIFSGK